MRRLFPGSGFYYSQVSLIFQSSPNKGRHLSKDSLAVVLSEEPAHRRDMTPSQVLPTDLPDPRPLRLAVTG